jgi:phosphate/sulfate permease
MQPHNDSEVLDVKRSISSSVQDQNASELANLWLRSQEVGAETYLAFAVGLSDPAAAVGTIDEVGDV